MLNVIWIIEENQELYALMEDSVSDFCILFPFSADDIKPLFKYRYLIKRQVIPLEKQFIHIQKNQFDYGLNEEQISRF